MIITNKAKCDKLTLEGVKADAESENLARGQRGQGCPTMN